MKDGRWKMGEREKERKNEDSVAEEEVLFSGLVSSRSIEIGFDFGRVREENRTEQEPEQEGQPNSLIA